MMSYTRLSGGSYASEGSKSDVKEASRSRTNNQKDTNNKTNEGIESGGASKTYIPCGKYRSSFDESQCLN